MKNQQQIDALVETFAFHEHEQKICLERADSVQGNSHARKMIAAFNTLVSSYADAGRDALARLLDHEYPDVRVTAAAFLLRYKHKKSMRVLRDVGAGKGLIAFEAREAIKRWEEGEWELDPGPLPEQERK